MYCVNTSYQLSLVTTSILVLGVYTIMTVGGECTIIN